MSDYNLEALLRDGTGKGPNRRARAGGRLPAILYGHGIEKPINISVDPKETTKALKTAKGLNAVLQLTVEGKTYSVMSREVQRNVLTRAVIHVDFVSPNPTREVLANVPLSITGRSVGVAAGGKLRTPYREVRIKARPSDIPAVINVDITNLDRNQTIMASGLDLPSGVTVVFERDFIIAKIFENKGEKADEKA